jgi:hypothetical protein
MKYIQQKWKDGLLLGMDCILFGNGKVIIGNHYEVYNPNTKERTAYWSPVCDTFIENIEKYDSDCWTCVDIFHGAIQHQEQSIVFGDGAMGNEGFVASINQDKSLNWGIFFTFSNPIMKAEIIENVLICESEYEGCKIYIEMDDLTKIKIELSDWIKNS